MLQRGLVEGSERSGGSRILRMAIRNDVAHFTHEMAQDFRMRGLYARRRQWLIDALHQQFAEGLQRNPQAGGMHLVAGLGQGNDVELAQRARAVGIAVEPLSQWYLEAQSRQGLGMGFTNVASAEQASTLALRLAQVQLRNTKSLLDRYKQAVGKGAVPQTQVDSAQADYEAAQVAVDQARLAISNHQIRAPFAGVVGITDIDPGQRVGPGVLITGVDSREIIYIDFEVPEAIVGQLDPAAMARIRLFRFLKAPPRLSGLRRPTLTAIS